MMTNRQKPDDSGSVTLPIHCPPLVIHSRTWRSHGVGSLNVHSRREGMPISAVLRNKVKLAAQAEGSGAARGVRRSTE